MLTVNATSTANYTCSAENVVQGRRTTDSRTFIVSVVHPVSREYLGKGMGMGREGKEVGLEEEENVKYHAGLREMVWG